LRREVRRLLLACSILAVCLAQSQPTPRTLRLYGWQDPTGEWNFTLLPGEVSREFSKKEVFDKKRAVPGVKALLRRISELAAGSTLIWYDHVSNERRFENIGYPPAKVIQEIRRYAEARKIEVLGP